MAKKNLSNKEIIIDLLQKQLIITLYKEGLTRDEIKLTLSISSNHVQAVLKNIKKIRKD